MSSLPADSPALPPQGESWLPGPKPPSEDWSRRKFYFVFAFLLAFHIALIFLFGTKKQTVPVPITNLPHLQLADSSSELIELGDPTLFARPNPHDLATTFWRHLPVITQPPFNWTEPPRYLPPDIAGLGADFSEYMSQSRATELPLEFKPTPEFPGPATALPNLMPAGSTCRISGGLAQLQLLTTNRLTSLPSLPRNDVIDRTTVQARVDTAGNILSAIVLHGSGDADADALALKIIRNLRFMPPHQLTLGEITFTWRTVPVTNNSAVP